MRGRALLLALMLPVSACDLEFTEPPRSVPARFFAWVQLSDSASGTLQLSASLAPGFDPNGEPRRVVNDTLRLLGTPLVPTSSGATGRREWRAEWPLTALPISDAIDLPIPEVDGVARPVSGFLVDPPRRAGPDTLTVGQGDPIVLRLDRTDPGSVGLQEALWELELRSSVAGLPLVRLTAVGPPPATITIPGDWIPAAAGQRLWARLVARSTLRSDGSSGQYMAVVVLQSRLHWTISVSDSPGSQGNRGPGGD